MGSSTTRTDFASRLFDVLRASGIAFCVLGDASQIPECMPSDLDLAIGGDDIAAIPPLLLDAATQSSAKLIQAVRYEWQAWCFIVAGFGPDGSSWFLQIDFCCGYCEAGRPLLGAAELIAGSRPRSGSSVGVSNIVLPAPAQGFIYYFLKKVEKQALDERQARHLVAMYLQDPKGGIVQLRRFWSAEDVDLIVRAASINDWSDCRRMLPRLRWALHRARPIPWAARLHEVERLLHRMFRPTGLWVVLLGPDGSGKSTILKQVAEAIGPSFRQSQLFHLRAPLLHKLGVQPIHENPHGQRRRGLAGSIVQLSLNLARCWLGFWLRVWPARLRSHFVGFDRYYPDVLVDPVRYRYGGPRWLARLTCALLPKPDLWIVLDASAQAIAARKTELPPSEIERQRLCYRQFVVGMRHGHTVDASHRSAEVAHAVEKIIIEFLAARTARRLALRP